MRYKYSPFAFVALLFFLSACDFISPPRQISPTFASSDEILNADREFSKRSAEIGIRKAYYEYMSDDAVLLRPQTQPLKGASAVEYLSLVNDEDYTLTWEPSDATIASSGDMGFSYGIYELTSQSETYKGTYVNIWKKQRDGTWKFVLNAGNQGISPNGR